MNSNHLWSIEKISKAWHLATRLHNGQKYGGPKEGEHVEYLNHIGGVVFEIMNALQYEKVRDADLAIHCAILHDTIEDTSATLEKIEEQFGKEVAAGVMALTKDESITDKMKKMQDSLDRILLQPKEVWMVKMADRIVNLSPPPYYWKNEKKESYRQEAIMIYENLKNGSDYLAHRLENKIEVYSSFFD